MITSRYDFDLHDSDNTDIAALLLKLPLTSMNDMEAEKQYFAKYSTIARENANVILELERVVAACKGNPGLQDIMFGLLVSAPQAYHQALLGMENYLKSGKLPAEQKVQDFLQDLAIGTILKLLTKGEAAFLQVAALFEIPVPEEVFNKIASMIGMQKDVDYKKRLLGFGVLEQFEDLVYSEKKALLLNHLVRSHIEKVAPESIQGLIEMITETLFVAWCGDKERYRPWICDKEVVRFALLSKHAEALISCAEKCVRGMHNDFGTKEAANYAVCVIALLEDTAENIPVGLYQIASDVCHRTGDVEKAQTYIEKTLEQKTEDRFTTASSYLQLARILVQKGEVEQALAMLETSKDLFFEIKAEREAAIISGDIARIKVSKGDVDEALKLHHEMIQVFDKLGDTREKAVTLGDIARIKVSKGDVDEALKLHHEELDVYDKLGDIYSRAATLLYMSRILLPKGDVQKAFEYLTESYKIMLKLGRLDGIAFVGMDLGNLLCQANQKEEGLKILQRSQEALEKLGKKELVQQVQEIIDQVKKESNE